MAEIFRKELTISLDDPDSIQAAIDAVNTLKERLPKAMESLCKHLVSKGVKIAQKKLGEFGIGEGYLYQSIRFEMEEGGKGIGYVIAGRPDDHRSDNPKWTKYSYAVFVEFGFGTGTYYDTSGVVVTKQRRIDTRKENGVKPTYGRSKEHPSGKYRYRDAETYNVLTSANGEKYLGWKYMDRKDGKWHTSYGQNPKPFMYRTLLELSKAAEAESGGRLYLYLYGGL